MNTKLLLGITALTLVFSPLALAHPGGTASDGAHYCWTNCAYWGEVYGVRHFHVRYTPPAVDKRLTDNIMRHVYRVFPQVFGRQPNSEEGVYWGMRVWGNLSTFSDDAKLVREMLDFKQFGYTYGDTDADVFKVPGQVKNEIIAERDKFTNKEVPAVVEIIFKQVFNKSIAPKESTYWKNRARTDKKTKSALKGAMSFHKGKGFTMPGVRF